MWYELLLYCDIRYRIASWYESLLFFYVPYCEAIFFCNIAYHMLRWCKIPLTVYMPCELESILSNWYRYYGIGIDIIKLVSILSNWYRYCRIGIDTIELVSVLLPSLIYAAAYRLIHISLSICHPYLATMLQIKLGLEGGKHLSSPTSAVQNIVLLKHFKCQRFFFYIAISLHFRVGFSRPLIA